MTHVEIRPASPEDLEEVNWVRRHRRGPGTNRDIDSAYRQVKNTLESGLGVAVIESEDYSGRENLLSGLRNRALEEGIVLQTAHVDKRKDGEGVKLFIRKYSPALEE